MKVISIVQLKGGAGKSTVAINLAGALSATKKVGLIDADVSQGSASSWFAVREQVGKAANIKLVMAANDAEIVPALEALADCDFVIIDCPPRLEKTIRQILMVSDLVIAPIGALAMEIWAASDTAKLLTQAQDAKPDLDARILWNKYRNTADEQLMLADGKKSLGLKSMKAVLGYRAAYTDTAGRGLTVLEWSNQKAKEEMTALVKEVNNILKRR